MTRSAAILLAGGSGSRVQQDVNKVYLPIGDRPLLEYSLDTLQRSQFVDEIVLVVRAADQRQAENLLTEVAPAKPVQVVAGGASRHESEHLGLEAIATSIKAGHVDLVAIHDGARPFMTLELLEAILTKANEVGGAIPGLGVHEHLYRLTEDAAVPLDPSTLIKAQTPQAFRAGPLLAAFRQATAAGFSGVDTAETMERYSDLAIEVVPGDPRNLKVTFVEDVFTVEEQVASWNHGSWKP